MATQSKKVKCDYCDKQLSDKYMLQRHIKTSKLCIRIQQLKPVRSNDEIKNIIRDQFDIDGFNDVSAKPNKFIYDFIYQHFINENTYITTDKDKFNGKYLFDNTIINDQGFSIIKQIFYTIILEISNRSLNSFGLKYIKSKTNSKICNLPPIYKTFFADKTSYKKMTKQIKPKNISDRKNKIQNPVFKPTIEETKVETKVETYICPCDQREHCSSYEEKMIHKNTKKHLEYIGYLLDNELHDEYKKVKQIFTFKNTEDDINDIDIDFSKIIFDESE